MAVIFLQTCLACGGIYVLGKRLKSFSQPVEAALAVVLLSSYPTLIAYEHLLLTEVGTFFFLSLILYICTSSVKRPLMGAFCLAIALAAGYYLRSSLLYMTPLVAVIYALRTLRRRPNEGYRGRKAVQALLLAGAGPFLLAYPWERNPMVSVRAGQSVLLYGLVKSAVLPPDDPILGNAAPAYRRAIEDSLSDGRLPMTGLQNGGEVPVLDAIYGDGPWAPSIFLRVVRTHPIRYLKGVGRNLLLFTELSGFQNDNSDWRAAALSPKSSLTQGLTSFPILGEEFRRDTSSSLTSRVLRQLSPFYDLLLLLGFWATVAALIMGIWRQNLIIVTFTALPLAFILLHALVLMSEARMAFPAYPLFLVNLVMLRCWLSRDFARKQPGN